MGDPTEPDPAPGSSAGGGGGGSTDDVGGGGATDSQDGGTEPRWKAVPDRFWWIPFFVGIALLVGYAAFLSQMMTRVYEEDLEWSRLVYLFSGIEALAFGAAGFFFGREVHRGRAEAAENRADTETRRSLKSEKEAITARSRLQTLAELADGAPAVHGAGRKSALVDTAGAAAALDAQLRLEAIADLSRKWRLRL